jgi:hypothetical protein
MVATKQQPMKQIIIGILVVVIIAAAGVLYCRLAYQPIGDDRVAQHITCVNNLKELGVTFKFWEGEHNDQFPFNLGTNAGGSREFCRPDTNGFDRNASVFIRLVSKDGDLTTPRLLVCPQDPGKHPATNWDSLTYDNITYRFRCGTNVCDANPQEIFAVCPVDGNTLYCDGTVKAGRQ